MNIQINDETAIKVLTQMSMTQGIEPEVLLNRIILGFNAMGQFMMGQSVEPPKQVAKKVEFSCRVGDTIITHEKLRYLMESFVKHIGAMTIYVLLLERGEMGKSALIKKDRNSSKDIEIESDGRTWYMTPLGQRDGCRRMREICQNLETPLEFEWITPNESELTDEE